MTIAILAERPTQRRHVDVEIPFFYRTTGPKPLHEVVLADEFAFRRGKRAQDIQRSSTQPYRAAITG
jgi:hypothetical protein